MSQSASPKKAFDGCSLGGGGLVLQGETVKIRLQNVAGAHGPVHVDWLRFSVPRDSVLGREGYVESDERLFAYSVPEWDELTRLLRLRKQIEHVTLDRSALAAARVLGRELCETMGPDFELVHEPKPGRDFFAFRLPVLRAGVEVGWVGGGATSNHPNQANQAAVVHVNLYGEGCLWVEPENMARVAVIGERLGGWVTRCDLAVDYWAGIDGGMSGLEPSYLAGDMDVRGKRPKVAHAGDWINRRACTFYLGSREAGKYTRVYLKGDQLFGLDAGDKWTRVELQWGDQLRVLPWAMLQKPAEYFAGASDWHASMLHQAGAQTVSPEKVACTPAAAGMTVQAEAFRNLSWLFRTARASIASAFRFLGDSEFFSVVDSVELPGRLSRFKDSEVTAGYAQAAAKFFNGVLSEPAPAFAP